MGAFDHILTTRDELRTLYREPHPLAVRKKLDHIDPSSRRFIEAAPFCLVSTADAEGRCDVSPRGGPPGFVRCLDERRLALPDLSGNNLLDTLENVLANPHTGLLFVLPGRDETLRVEGTAHVTTDPGVLGLWDGELRRPKVAIGIEVGEVFAHCAKAFRRAEVWDPSTWDRYRDAPAACELLVEGLGLDVDREAMRADLEAGYARDLRREREV